MFCLCFQVARTEQRARTLGGSGRPSSVPAPAMEVLVVLAVAPPTPPPPPTILAKQPPWRPWYLYHIVSMCSIFSCDVFVLIHVHIHCIGRYMVDMYRAFCCLCADTCIEFFLMLSWACGIIYIAFHCSMIDIFIELFIVQWLKPIQSFIYCCEYVDWYIAFGYLIENIFEIWFGCIIWHIYKLICINRMTIADCMFVHSGNNDHMNVYKCI